MVLINGMTCPIYLKPEILKEFYNEGKYFDLIYDKVIRTNNSYTYTPISSEYGKQLIINCSIILVASACINLFDNP